MNEYRISTVNIFGIPIFAMPFLDAINVIRDCVLDKRGGYVCVANSHMIVESHFDRDFANILRKSVIVTPDGMPLAWLIRFITGRSQDRIAGMDILNSVCKFAQDDGFSVFLVGSTDDILHKMIDRFTHDFPRLQVSGKYSPPFEPLTPEYVQAIANKVNVTKPDILLVALGCPKQERLMSLICNKLSCVSIGLGGVFPIYARQQKWAPLWMREHGLEWLYRLLQEPRRLAKRYLVTNTLFIILAFKELLTRSFKL